MGETFDPPSLPKESALYWDLHLNHHAVTLSTTAPYDTLTATAIPRNIRQEPIAGLPAPQYVSSDPERVLVSPEGVLMAVAPTAPGTHVTVVATLTSGNLKHTDYVLVRIENNPTPPVLATLSVHPLLPDSAKVAAIVDGAELEVGYQLPVRATDETGAPITDLFVSFRLANSDRVQLDGDGRPEVFNERAVVGEVSGRVVGNLPGRINIYATATSFGVTKADTLPFRIGLPLTSRFILKARTDGTPGSTLQERVLRVGVGALVYWQGTQGDGTMDADITFTDPTHVAAFPTSPVYTYPVATPTRGACRAIELIRPGTTDCTGSGNFVLHPGFSRSFNRNVLGYAVRTFPVPGTYDFHSTLQGFNGRIIVIDESEE